MGGRLPRVSSRHGEVAEPGQGAASPASAESETPRFPVPSIGDGGVCHSHGQPGTHLSFITSLRMEGGVPWILEPFEVLGFDLCQERSLQGD